MLLSFFERLYPDSSKRHRLLAESFFISIDNAHASHPNHPERHDPSHAVFLNRGPVLKMNASHKYTSTALSGALFKLLCIEAKVPMQEFVMRNDLQCGSTIGPIIAAKLGVKTVDVGAASLAMHSIRELTGSQDPILLFQVIQHFLQRDQIPKIYRK
jgi:aspartyl aminopeptidase